MKNEIIANSCRICLTKTKKLRSLYKPIDEGDEAPNEMLHLITGIKVEKMDEHEYLPKNICKNCELSLSMAYEFRENALKTHEIVLSYLKELYENDSSDENNKSSMSMYKAEYEDIMDLEPLGCVVALDEDIQNLESEQDKYCLQNDEESVSVDIYDQTETSVDMNESKRFEETEDTTSKSYFEHLDKGKEDNEGAEVMYDDHEEAEYTAEQIEITPVVESNQKILPKTNSTRSNRKRFAKISTKADKSKGKVKDIYLSENMKLIPRRGRKPSNSNQIGHICDICGNVFSKRGRMMEHRQRHDKECRFCCEICDKKFLTRELLRKHMFSHSGGKPLKCEFCSRTFYYESVRKAHEAVHKGLKPYVCDICNKSFSYAHALKKHKLIHAEIKLYRCEYCHKDFRLQHHMKQHELTKLHKNAVLFAKNDNISFEDCGEVVKGREDNLEEDSIIFIEEIIEDQLAGTS